MANEERLLLRSRARTPGSIDACGMTPETELKLKLSLRSASRALSHPAIESAATGKAARARLISVYYDTPKFDLWSAQISIRLRQTPTGWVQTAKWGGQAAGGLHTRQEMECSVPEQKLDFDVLAGRSGLETLASLPLQRKVKPVFVTEFERSTRMLELADGTGVEVGLDRGQIVCGTARLRICELELELKTGEVLALFDLATALLKGLAVRPAYRSKAERGYLLAGVKSRPAKAQRIELDPGFDIGRSAAHIVGSALAQVQANADGMLVGEDIEFLHQMRVGLRRLRSCVSAFAHPLPESATAALRAELKWLGGRLGPARDWDVFRTDTMPQLAAGLREVVEASSLDALMGSAETLGDAARREARTAWNSRRAAQLLLELGRVAAGGGFLQSSAAMGEPVEPFASALLERRMARVLARGKRRRAATVAQLHALRIAVKKLRYAVEFFGPLYPDGKVDGFREPLVRLQDCLGALCDASTLVSRVGAAVPGDKTLVDCARGWGARAIHQERLRLRTLWRRFRRSRPFW
jgi:triphosphatase